MLMKHIMRTYIALEKCLPIDILILTGNKVTRAAGRALVTMATMPSSTHTIAFLPDFLRSWNGNDISNNFVTRDAGESKPALLGEAVAVQAVSR